MSAIESTVTLGALAHTANREHALVEQHGEAMVAHAVKAGEALIAARAQCPHGTWGDWLATNFNRGRNPDRAHLYMRLARHKELLRRHSTLGIGDAQRVIAAHTEPTQRSATQGARRRAATAALKAQERDRRAKAAAIKQGGAIAELYSMAERMQDVLGQAHREASSRDVRSALAEAGASYRAMRDSIVRALGASS